MRVSLLFVLLSLVALGASLVRASTVSAEIEAAMPAMSPAVEAATEAEHLDAHVHSEDDTFFLELAKHVDNAAELEALAEQDVADGLHDEPDNAFVEVTHYVDSLDEAGFDSEGDAETEFDSESETESEADFESEMESEAEAETEFEHSVDAESDAVAEQALEFHLAEENPTLSSSEIHALAVQRMREFYQNVGTHLEELRQPQQPALVETASDSDSHTLAEITSEGGMQAVTDYGLESDVLAAHQLDTTLATEADINADHNPNALEHPRILLQAAPEEIQLKVQHAEEVGQFATLFNDAAKHMPSVAAELDTPEVVYTDHVF